MAHQRSQSVKVAAGHQDELPRPSSSGSSAGSDAGGGALHLSRYATHVEAEPLSDDNIGPFNERVDQSLYGSHEINGLESHDGIAPLSTISTTYASSNTPNSATFGPSSIGSNFPPSSATSWSQFSSPRSKSGSDTGIKTPNPNTISTPRPERPSYTRTPSHAYAPPRRPSQYPKSHRSSIHTNQRLNADAEYRAQKKAYVQRLQRDNAENEGRLNPDAYPPSLGYSSGTETEDESPSTGEYLETDPQDQEALLYYGAENVSPSEEELKIPANRERLEWHSMLAKVLTGDVVRQEKKRMTGATETQGENSLQTEIWFGVRAKVCGRAVSAQKRLIEHQRATVAALVDDITTFEIKGEAEVGKSAVEQVQDVVKSIEKCENLYPTGAALEAAHPRAASDAFKSSCTALLSWQNTTVLINTELSVLKAWVGNEEMDFSKQRDRGTEDDNLIDESSFIDRILKEDGLKSLQGDNSMLNRLGQVIEKAKSTLIENANAFASKYLPPYIEELLTLINFPSRLVHEIIRVRLSYASNIRDLEKQGTMMAEQMISQFQILLKLAVKIKEAYILVSQPEPGWNLPPCIDENFDQIVLSALQFYFKILGWELSANKNTFKEAEILEQEWEFCNALGRHFESGDVEVAEQFSSLTSKSLYRLTAHFEKELQRQPEEVAGVDMDRRYKQVLDSVRVRQRKLFRFSRLLAQTFENTTEYNISMPQHELQEILDTLLMSGHILVTTSSPTNELYIVASPTLVNRPREVQSLLRTCYHATEGVENPSNPYVLIINPEQSLYWDGPRQEVEMELPKYEIGPGKLRLVAEGSQSLLQYAQATFSQTIGTQLDIIVPQRANLPSVDRQLQKIKRTAYKLSNTIMDSVENLRRQLVGLQCQELIQTCFAFATEFGQRSVMYMDYNRRQLNNLRLTRLALDWVSFICDDCVASDRKTFRWTVTALEFAMVMTRGQNILSITDEEYTKLRTKVAACMALLISHFDIMGARSIVAAQAEKQRVMDNGGGQGFRLDVSKLKDDEESARLVRDQWMTQLAEIDALRKSREAERQALGRVLEDSSEADRSLTFLSSSATNVTIRWQQGQYIGGGTFGSVYAAMNLDSGHLMAVKEIRLQDPQVIPTIASQIREEMGVLQILDHPNIVSYYGIEVHRDKVYIFMEYCSGGSLAGLLEHGRIEDETVITVYALQMLEGLAYLHESGVIHRDIKPENILLDHNGVVKYVDFGAAKVITRQTGRTLAASRPPGAVRQGRQNSMTGTPMYMSPEVINPVAAKAGEARSAPPRPGAVDTWSLGCVILEMATGRRPWATLDNEWAIMYNIAKGNPPQLPGKEQLSDAGIDFLKRCFERDPARRASAAELLQHDWIMALRNQLSLDPAANATSAPVSAVASATPSSDEATPSSEAPPALASSGDNGAGAVAAASSALQPTTSTPSPLSQEHEQAS